MAGSTRQEQLPTFGTELKLDPSDWVARGMLTGHRVIHFFVVPGNSPLLPEGKVVTRHEDAVLISADVPGRPLHYPDTTSQSYVIKKFVAKEERDYSLETGEPLQLALPYALRKVRPGEPEAAGA